MKEILESRPDDRGSGKTAERGVAIIIALLFVIIVGGLVSSGSILMKAAIDRAEVRFRREAQATQFARSGLTEALSWFRRQTTQPASTFAPLRDTVATPPVLDTDEPEIGLVREFQITDDIWGRYEVWRQDEADPDPARLDFRRQYECRDLSAERGFSGTGAVWLVRAIGYVFQRKDDTVAFDTPPNRVLAMVTLESEIQRMTLQPPSQAAMSVNDGNSLHINTMGRIRGGSVGAGVFYPSGSGHPTTGPSSEQRVTGSPSLSMTSTYDDSVMSVFGVALPELRSMADIVITDANDFPNPVPAGSIVFADVNNISFDAARSLNGNGIVYFAGGVSLSSGNNSSFSGLLYIEGGLTMRQTADIYGAVVCKGNCTIQGSGDYATIWYDDDVLSALRTKIGQYRWAGAFRPILNQE